MLCGSQYGWQSDIGLQQNTDLHLSFKTQHLLTYSLSGLMKSYQFLGAFFESHRIFCWSLLILVILNVFLLDALKGILANQTKKTTPKISMQVPLYQRHPRWGSSAAVEQRNDSM